jgi:hypothetical protein
MAEEAISRAKELDEYYRRTGRLVGPLVGPYKCSLQLR